MATRVNELHAAVVHLPLVLLPMSALVDLSAALGHNRRRARFGRKLWWATVASGAVAGALGMAASREVKADDRTSEDMMWIHGIGNAAILTAGLGMALYRSLRRPTVAQAAVGLLASGAAFYTAYLGGTMVYGRGVGIAAMPPSATTGVGDSPEVASLRGPVVLVRDTVRGALWLLSRAAEVVAGRRKLDLAAFGLRGLARERAKAADVGGTRAAPGAARE